MKKLLIATKFPRILESISKTFEFSKTDDSGKRNLWINEKDFTLDAEKKLSANHLLMHNKKPWTVYQYDPSKIKRADAEAENKKVSIKELIETVIQTNPFRILDGSIKFIVTEDTKEDLAEVLKNEYKAFNSKQLVSITVNNNIRTDEVLNKKVVTAIPDLSLDINDDEIESMDDLLAKTAEAKQAQTKESQEKATTFLDI